MTFYPFPACYSAETPEATAKGLVEQMGLSLSLARRWVKVGMRWLEADRFATHVARHPSELWPDWDAPVALQRIPADTATCLACGLKITVGQWAADSLTEQAREWSCANGHRGVITLSMRLDVAA